MQSVGEQKIVERTGIEQRRHGIIRKDRVARISLQITCERHVEAGHKCCVVGNFGCHAIGAFFNSLCKASKIVNSSMMI